MEAALGAPQAEILPSEYSVDPASAAQAALAAAGAAQSQAIQLAQAQAAAAQAALAGQAAAAGAGYPMMAAAPTYVQWQAPGGAVMQPQVEMPLWQPPGGAAQPAKRVVAREIRVAGPGYEGDAARALV